MQLPDRMAALTAFLSLPLAFIPNPSLQNKSRAFSGAAKPPAFPCPSEGMAALRKNQLTRELHPLQKSDSHRSPEALAARKAQGHVSSSFYGSRNVTHFLPNSPHPFRARNRNFLSRSDRHREAFMHKGLHKVMLFIHFNSPPSLSPAPVSPWELSQVPSHLLLKPTKTSDFNVHPSPCKLTSLVIYFFLFNALSSACWVRQSMYCSWWGMQGDTSLRSGHMAGT